MATLPRCRNTLTRKRPISGTGKERFISQVRSYSSCSAVDMSSYAIFLTVGPSSTSEFTGMMVPRILIDIGAPAEMNRSEACFSAMSLSTGVRNITASLG